MATIGEKLKAAREAKGISEVDAGVATKILTKTIQDMEADDFSEMPAATYAKGFIRLYATFLGIDPAPLVDEYIEKNPAKPREPLEAAGQEGRSSSSEGLFGAMTSFWDRLPGTAWKDVRVLGGSIAALLLLAVLISVITTCSQRRKQENPSTQMMETDSRTLLDEPLPDLYLVEPGKIESAQ